ncbi:nucleotidyltransferase family protein [Negadavirga shengliensis]|uniref:Nucleotidyltransferase family protein n=1 Tax=Negadavirga shengliensis TaxID=1389218 RepID=A0ABV9T6K0_9BACT
MVDLIKDNQEALIKLCQQYHAQTMHVFGSASTNHFHEFGDVDILISFKEIPIEKYTDNYFCLHEELEQLFGRKVDLIAERSLSNPCFIKRVEDTKQLLYAA